MAQVVKAFAVQVNLSWISGAHVQNWIWWGTSAIPALLLQDGMVAGKHACTMISNHRQE